MSFREWGKIILILERVYQVAALPHNTASDNFGFFQEGSTCIQCIMIFLSSIIYLFKGEISAKFGIFLSKIRELEFY